MIATEGAITEQQYFGRFNNENATIQIKCLSNRKHNSAPQKVLAEMRKHLKAQELWDEDQAWLVVDRDDWSEEHLDELHDWSTESEQYGFALSNPMFEYWLILHFEDGHGIASARDCKERIKQHLPDYDKNLKLRLFTDERVQDAIGRAETKDQPPCTDWPRQTGTTVYRLVQAILAS